MSPGERSTDIERVRLERDFYLRLLELGNETEFKPLLKEALALIVEISGARQGYLEIHGASDDAERGWSLAHGFSSSEVEQVRSRISRGIIAEALSTGRIVETSSAMLDPRFLARRSVQGLKIEAVLCAPIGNDPPLGVLYLEGRDAPGSFTAEDCERAKLFARHLAPLTGNTPFASIDVPPNQSFRPTVVQSVDVCLASHLFPVSNTGRCQLDITEVSINANPTEYALSGVPSYPIILEPGHIAGDGALRTVFAPQSVDRDVDGQVSVTWVHDPVTGATMSETRDLCGEGAYTGARVLVTQAGVPLDTVKSIRLNRINANRNKDRLDTVDNARNLPLVAVTPNAPCTPFQYHREYGTVSNPVQLLPGSYEVTVQTRIDGKMRKRSVGFDVNSCGFNPTVIVNLE